MELISTIHNNEQDIHNIRLGETDTYFVAQWGVAAKAMSLRGIKYLSISIIIMVIRLPNPRPSDPGPKRYRYSVQHQALFPVAPPLRVRRPLL